MRHQKCDVMRLVSARKWRASPISSCRNFVQNAARKLQFPYIYHFEDSDVMGNQQNLSNITS